MKKFLKLDKGAAAWKVLATLAVVALLSFPFALLLHAQQGTGGGPPPPGPCGGQSGCSDGSCPPCNSCQSPLSVFAEQTDMEKGKRGTPTNPEKPQDCWADPVCFWLYKKLPGFPGTWKAACVIAKDTCDVCCTDFWLMGDPKNEDYLKCVDNSERATRKNDGNSLVLRPKQPKKSTERESL